MIIEVHTSRSFQESAPLLVVLGHNFAALEKLKPSERLTMESPQGIINVLMEQSKTYSVVLHPYDDFDAEANKENVPSNREE